MKILFKIFPQRSHLNATFALARALAARGHEVVYAGVAPLRRQVEAQGFAYFVQTEDIFTFVERRGTVRPLTFWTPFVTWYRKRKWSRSLLEKYLALDPFAPVLRAVRPDIFLVDSPYSFFALSLDRSGVPFGIIESMMNLDRDVDCPPLDTTLVPTGRAVNRGLIWLHWRRYFLKRDLLGALGFRADCNRRFVKARASLLGTDLGHISFDRYFHLGLRHVPEVILSPRLLDFPRTPAPNQIYIGPAEDPIREEAMSDYSFAHRFEQLVAARTAGRPLVYCSLGTGSWRYRGAQRFLRRLLECARGAGWNLIMAIGTEFEISDFHPPANASVFQTVPQIEVLRHVDLMITHGGMNSVRECASMGVPMLVYPGTKQIDQAGNAARVVYHGLGLQGQLARESAPALRRKIEHVLGTPACQAAARRIAARMRATGDLAADVDRLLQCFAVSAPASHRNLNHWTAPAPELVPGL